MGWVVAAHKKRSSGGGAWRGPPWLPSWRRSSRSAASPPGWPVSWCSRRGTLSAVCDSVGSREEDRRDRVGVALPSPAPPPSFPNRFFPPPSPNPPGILPPLSPDLGPRGQRRGGRGTQKAKACGPEDSLSLAGAWGRWVGWGPLVDARARGRGSDGTTVALPGVAAFLVETGTIPVCCYGLQNIYM
jgi:hypothetical protein